LSDKYIEGKTEGRAEGRAEGLAEGELKAKQTIALQLLAEGISPEKTVMLTGLALSEVIKLVDGNV
jgi:predicted transposase YdaD